MVSTPAVVLTSYTTESVVMIHFDHGTNASSPFFVPRVGLAMDGSAPVQTVLYLSVFAPEKRGWGGGLRGRGWSMVRHRVASSRSEHAC